MSAFATAAFFCHTAGCNSGRRVLDCSLVFTRPLLPALRKLQQNLWNVWCSDCVNDVAVLDRFCHAGRSGT